MGMYDYTGKLDYLSVESPSVYDMLMKPISDYQNQGGGNMSVTSNTLTLNIGPYNIPSYLQGTLGKLDTDLKFGNNDEQKIIKAIQKAYSNGDDNQKKEILQSLGVDVNDENFDLNSYAGNDAFDNVDIKFNDGNTYKTIQLNNAYNTLNNSGQSKWVNQLSQIGSSVKAAGESSDNNIMTGVGTTMQNFGLLKSFNNTRLAGKTMANLELKDGSDINDNTLFNEQTQQQINATGKKIQTGSTLAQIGLLADAVTSYLPDKSAKDGKYRDLNKGVDNLASTTAVGTLGAYGLATGVGSLTSGAAAGTLGASINGVATSATAGMSSAAGIAGGALAGMAVGRITNALGGGTDNMTVQDSLLNSDLGYGAAGALMGAAAMGAMGPVGWAAGGALMTAALVNGIAGSRTDTITKNEDVFANIGGSYTGTENKVNEALQYSGKRYGLFSSGARKRANRKIREAKRQQDILEGINEEVVNQQAAKDYMGSMYNTQYTFDQQGGYQQAVTVGRMGMKLQSARDILKNRMMQGELNISDFTSGGLNLSPIEEVGSLKVARMGGTLELSCHCKSSTEGVLTPHNCTTGELNITIIGNNGKTEKIKYKHGGKTDEPEEDNDYTPVDTQKIISQILKNSKKIPNFIKRIVDEPYVRTIYFINPKTGKKEWGSHFITSSNFMGKEIIYPLIQQTEDGGLQFFDQEEALGRALKNEDYLIADSPEDAEIFGRYYKQFFNDKFGPGSAMYLYIGSGGKDNTPPTNFEGTPIMKKGGVLEENVEVQPLENKGGDINVIPDGALHARLNHIDNEDLTRKGIPVVSNNGEQQAEIENSEIILRLALTERLEMLSGQYDDTDDEDEKDRIAIEAGKLLVDEILNNTIDNTKNLL